LAKQATYNRAPMQKSSIERWNLGQATKEKCINVTWVYRDDIRKDKIHLKLTFTRDVKGNKSSYHCVRNSKKLNKEKISQFLNGADDLVAADT